MEFIESFMKFSFSDDDICVVLISENVALIEAKSSSPRIENEEKFQKFISDIGQKFADSLQLFSDIKSKKKGDEAFLRLPANLQNTQIATEAYKIYLIIHGHQLDWLLGLMDALRKELNDVVKQWNLRDSNVKVYNEATALENKLIVAYIPKAETKSLRLPDGSIDDAKVQAWLAAHDGDKK